MNPIRCLCVRVPSVDRPEKQRTLRQAIDRWAELEQRQLNLRSDKLQNKSGLTSKAGSEGQGS